MFVVISVLWGSVAAGYLLRRHPVPGLDRIMTYAVWCMLFLMGTEVGGNTLLMRSLGSLGLEAALLVVFTTLGCSVPALWLWRKARTKAESCPVAGRHTTGERTLEETLRTVGGKSCQL